MKKKYVSNLYSNMATSINISIHGWQPTTQVWDVHTHIPHHTQNPTKLAPPQRSSVFGKSFIFSLWASSFHGHEEVAQIFYGPIFAYDLHQWSSSVRAAMGVAMMMMAATSSHVCLTAPGYPSPLQKQKIKRKRRRRKNSIWRLKMLMVLYKPISAGGKFLPAVNS